MANPPRCHAVFVDTSLDTHMAMAVEEGDTVADFKKRIQCEHTFCFPEIGKIGVNALQVKRRGFLYHLSDSMCVKNAFDGVKSRWFVYVDACSLVKQGLEITGPLPKLNGVLCFERNVLGAGADEQLNENDKSLQNVQKEDCLNGNDDGSADGDVVMKVREDLEIEFEHMGDEHCRTSSSDTNKMLESQVDGRNVPNGGSDKVLQLGRKRKIDDSQNPVNKISLNGDFSGEQANETVIAKKKRKIQKKENGSAKQGSQEINKSTVDASDNGAQDNANNTADGHQALHSVPSADARLESENEPINEEPVKDLSLLNRLPIGSTNVLSNDEDMVRPDPASEDSFRARTIVDGKHFSGPDAIAAPVSDFPIEKTQPNTKQKKKKSKSRTLRNQFPTKVTVTVETNCVENLKDTSIDGAENVNLRTSGNTEEALNNSKGSEDYIRAKTNVDGKHFIGPDAIAAPVSEVPTEKTQLSTKQKKKKSKSKTLRNQLPTEFTVPVETNSGDDTTGLQSTNAADEVNLKISGTQNTEKALNNSNQLSTDQISSEDKNTALPSSPAKLPLDNPKLAGLHENNHVAEGPEVLHTDGARVSRMSGKASKKEKKDGESHKKKKAEPVTKSVETTQVEIVGNPNTENIGSKSEKNNISHSGLDGKIDEVAGSNAAEKTTGMSSAMGDVIVTDGSDMKIGKAKEANPKASQLKGSSEHANHVLAVEIDKKKSKRKRSSATNPPEIQSQEKVATPLSIDDINSKDKYVGADKGEIETAEKNNGNNATSICTFTKTAHARLAEQKHHEAVVETNPLVDVNTKDDKLDFGTEEINFSEYFVPSQQKPEVIAPGIVGNVNEERIVVKKIIEDSKVKKKSTILQVGKKSQLESSQESISMCQTHGAVRHSDTESFRVPKDKTQSNSGKQKSTSSNKKSKQTTSEVATFNSPSASETRKSTSSHKATKLNETRSNAVPQHQSKENAETFTASNSTILTPVGIHQTKSKQPASKKGSTAKIKKTESAADRRKTLLSANIFKDDNDESSEDEEAVTSGHSGSTYLDDPDASVFSEMEDDTGFATPITVGQRKAAEVDNDSSMNKYTLEKLRESARLEKEKRAQESGIQLEEFVPDSRADQN